MSFEADYRKLLKRLEASDTKRKRKSARAAIRKLLRGELKSIEKQYPLLQGNGEPVRQPKAAICPACRHIAKSWSALAEHCVKKHFVSNSHTIKCWCDKEWYCPWALDDDYPRAETGRKAVYRAIGQHLRNVNLKKHATIGAIKQF